jgi:ribonuclease D
MSIISDTRALEDLCRDLAEHPFFTIDTEFLRDKTYYPQLCLVQVAFPEGEAYAIDPLAPGLDLSPLTALLANEKVVKVFHAARQDLEIFFNLTGSIPHPIFDTQVAAMVCGYGESVGYNNLVHDICREKLDKGAQFTDWSRRPLSAKQMHYALDDVRYLRQVYLHLESELRARGREDWVLQEMKVLTSPETYRNLPEQAWQRIKIKSDRPKVLSVLREAAAWREREAQRRDIPRQRVLRDETLADIAVHAPRKPEELQQVRGFSADLARGRFGREVLAAVEKGLAVPAAEAPQMPKRVRLAPELVPVVEMLKMLLRIQCSEQQVAAKIVASGDDLEALALEDDPDIPAMKGWRFDAFGRDALALKRGEIMLGLKNRQIVKVDLRGQAPAAARAGKKAGN